jgi:hypothetical protein
MEPAGEFLFGILIAGIEIVNEARLRIVVAVGIRIIARLEHVRPVVRRVRRERVVALAIQ